MSKKATLEELLKRKEQGKAEKMQTKEVEVSSLGLTFTIVKQPLTRVLRLMDTYGNTNELSTQFELYKELIYMSVPLLQSEQLQSAYECADPLDIVSMILEDNLTAITELGEAISDLYGLGTDQAVKELKN